MEEENDQAPLRDDTDVLSAITADDDQAEWRPKLEEFTRAKKQKEDLKGKPRALRRFYKRQNELIGTFEEVYKTDDDVSEERREVDERNQRKADICAKASFFVNLLLFAAKLVSSVLSGSLSILSSVVDSAVDLISGAVMWCTSSAMKNKDQYKYPGGKRRMEPLAILVLSVIMSMASAMVVIKSAEQIQEYATVTNTTLEATLGPRVATLDIIIICSTIGLKLALFLVMWRIKLPSVQALSQDHRNDVISNTVALAMGFIGSRYWRFADPIGAIVMSLYIIISWMVTASQQVRLLAGRAAKPDFQKRITWLCINHHAGILAIDTVIVYHFGTNFLVEVDIVLPESMMVREAHDIQESLQQRLERLEDVERAFVHIDFETTHSRSIEHKVV